MKCYSEMVAAGDIGRLAAKTLQESWNGNRYLELEGPQRYSMFGAAAAFSRLLGADGPRQPGSQSPLGRPV